MENAMWRICEMEAIMVIDRMLFSLSVLINEHWGELKTIAHFYTSIYCFPMLLPAVAFGCGREKHRKCMRGKCILVALW